jgi:signal transduction histidine kinase
LFLQLFINAVLSEKKSRQELAIAHEQLRRYALRIEDIATLQERNRLAREIHDSLGHSLVGFNLHLEAALRLFAIAPQESRELLIEAKEMSDIALQEVRRSVAKLRTDPLQGKSLQEALAILMQNFQNSTNIIPQLELNLSINLSHEISVAIYRIVQESLTNICKYAKATKVKISLKSDQDLELVILDNGQGFQLEKNSTGFGLQGMKERTIALGGKLKIISDRDQGCKIIVSIPLPKNST